MRQIIEWLWHGPALVIMLVGFPVVMIWLGISVGLCVGIIKRVLQN
jgi:hypothetical protein